MWRLAVRLMLWAWIPLCWQPVRGQSPGVGVQPSHKQKQVRKADTTEAKEDHRGTKESPLVVDVNSSPKSQEEAAEAKAEKKHKYFIDRWMLRIAVGSLFVNTVLAAVGIAGIRYARRTLATLKRQVDLTEPRLHVDSVRAAGLKNGQSPVFFVKVINSGIIAAEEVAISMRAEIAVGKIIGYNKDQVMVIPANGWRECSIGDPDMILDQNQLAAYDAGTAPLRISVYVKWSDKADKYCYKYNPWPSGKRPKGVPRFLPCDFDTSLQTVIQPENATLSVNGGIPTVKIEGRSEEPPA